jgi:hypothetical protein
LHKARFKHTAQVTAFPTLTNNHNPRRQHMEKAVKTLAKAMKNTATGIYDPCNPEEATHIRLCFPGPFSNRLLPVNGNTRPNWQWNQSETSPTLSPSIRTSDGTIICHSFVTDGMVHFCDDSTHELAGKIVPLEEVN